MEDMTAIKETLEGFKETEIGVLPEDWEVHQIKQIANTFSGSTPNRKSNDYWVDGKIPWLKSGELKDGFVGSAEEYITEKALEETSVKFVHEDTLVVAMYGATAGKVGYIQEKATINQAICAIELKKELADTLYCFYWFILNRPNLLRERFGGAQPNLNQQIVRNIFVPLPPLPEQQKIASVLSAVQEAKEKTENVLSALKELKKSMMKHLFTYGAVSVEEVEKVPLKETEIGMIPEHWEVKKLEDVADSFIGGGTPSTTKNEYWNGDIHWTTSKKIAGLYLHEGERKITTVGLNESSTHLIPKNNLIIGTRVGVGKVTVNLIDVAISQDLTGVFIDKDKYSHIFLAYELLSERVQTIFSQQLRGTTIKGIPRDDLKKISLVIPPLSEQYMIAEILSAIDDKINAEQTKKTALNTLFKTLLSLLMTGKIRVKDIYI